MARKKGKTKRRWVRSKERERKMAHIYIQPNQLAWIMSSLLNPTAPFLEEEREGKETGGEARWGVRNETKENVIEKPPNKKSNEEDMKEKGPRP